MNALRLYGPVALGLALVVWRQSWGSVVVLGLLLAFSMYVDGRNRRADDVEDMEAEFNHRLGNLNDRVNEASKELTQARETAALSAAAMTKMAERIKDHDARLDAMAQQRKGPLL